jgi:hypothetical protein
LRNDTIKKWKKRGGGKRWHETCFPAACPYGTFVRFSRWARLIELAIAPTNRAVRLTNTMINIPTRFYRLAARP